MECLKEHSVGNFIKIYKFREANRFIYEGNTKIKKKIKSWQQLKLVEIITNSTPNKLIF